MRNLVILITSLLINFSGISSVEASEIEIEIDIKNEIIEINL